MAVAGDAGIGISSADDQPAMPACKDQHRRKAGDRCRDGEQGSSDT